MEKVVIVDYGMSNLHSVESALRHVADDRIEIVVSDQVSVIDNADRVVFPGQGAAADCMKMLSSHELVESIIRASRQKPFLGICMGLQVLLSHSQENNGVSCLNVISGEVRSLKQAITDQCAFIKLKIPHMGWNTIAQSVDHPLWHNIADHSYFYFVHSYFVDPVDSTQVAGTTEYGVNFPSVLATENLFAMQCHPEKSADNGLRLLKNFLQWKAN